MVPSVTDSPISGRVTFTVVSTTALLHVIAEGEHMLSPLEIRKHSREPAGAACQAAPVISYLGNFFSPNRQKPDESAAKLLKT
jgi:hypothetical protein